MTISSPLHGRREPPGPAGGSDGAEAHRATLLRTVELEVDGLKALHQALGQELGSRVLAAVQIILSLSGRVVVTGMGKSGHIARKISATLA